MAPLFADKLQELRIDAELPASALERVYLPLAAWLVQRKTRQTLVVGINGGQGSGKSTLCALLQLILRQGFGLSVAGLSLDDFYKTRAERRQLADGVHPLLLTRGVPGTHDVALALSVLAALKSAQPGDSVAIPVFDKAQDDRCPPEQWRRFHGPADIVIFEGWCVAARPESAAALSRPINTLETEEDPDGRWRRYVNAQLQGEYARLFEQLDVLLMLKVPSMEHVFQWRSLQEEKLAASLRDTPQHATRLMDAAAIRRFIMHYERITRHMLEEMPERADVTLFVDEAHQIGRIRTRSAR
ncbi:MAG: hypothetical protein EPN21_16065 [Methylococcaceae bacterium]|nr:MAG: hypothetical protein EPN21_16065 [Methylococcaceae bacterium]